MEIKREEFTPEFYSEMVSLFMTHCKEINDVFGDFDPNLETYFTLEMAGMLDFFVAREAENVLGYTAFLTNKNMHYKTKTVSAQDLLYVVPQHRKDGVGSKIIRFAEIYLKEEKNVDYILVSSSATMDISKVFERQGYKKLETTYFKHIGGN